VDDGADGARHIERFTETDQPFVGMDAQPHGIGLLIAPNRLKPGDFHPNLSVQKIKKLLTICEVSGREALRKQCYD